MKILQKYWFEISLIIIILCGAILRLSRFWQPCLVTEELDTILMMSWPIKDLILNTAFGHPPLYFLLAKTCTVLTGSVEEWVLRLPALLFGIIQIPAIYLLGKEYANKTTGLLAAFITAITYSYIWYSDYARPYTLILLLFTVAGIYYIRILEQPKRKDLIIFAIISAACLWTHFYSVIPLGLAWMTLTVKNPRHLKYLLCITIPAIPITLIYFFNIAKGFRALAEYSVTRFPTSPTDLAIQIPLELLGYASIILIPLFIYGLATRKYNYEIPVALVPLGTIAITMISIMFFNPVPRYILLVSPWIIIIAIRPVSDLIERQMTITRKAIVASLTMYSIAALNALTLLSLYTLDYCQFKW